MACNDNKKKHECGGKVLASCTFYEGGLPEWSKLKDENCVSVEEVLDELYEKVTELVDGYSLENFESDCIDVDSDDKMVDIIQKISDKVCDTDSDSDDSSSGSNGAATTILAKNISLDGIDLDCFQGVCDENIYNLEDFIRALVAEHCKETE